MAALPYKSNLRLNAEFTIHKKDFNYFTGSQTGDVMRAAIAVKQSTLCIAPDYTQSLSVLCAFMFLVNFMHRAFK